MQRHPRHLPTLQLADALDAPSGNEFDSDVDGRGDSYRRSQQQSDVRLTGILTLLELALGHPVPTAPGPELRVLDVLGGDGTLARGVAATHGQAHENHWILTGDMSPNMTAQALDYGLPAICQPAQRLLLRDDSFDAVILAYGTHHIPPEERKIAFAEAWRVLRPGGRLVVHDFAQGGPVATWFEQVVHPHTTKGHRYQHFTPEELHTGLGAVGFADVVVDEMYDPFIVSAASRAAAVETLSTYVCDMYGLVGLRRYDDWRARTWDLMCRHFSYPETTTVAPIRRVDVRRRDRDWVATMPRVALTGVGVK